MSPFWRGAKSRKSENTQRHSSPSILSSSSAFGSDVGTEEHVADVGRATQYRISKEEWFSPGDRFEPEQRNLKFSTGPASCEFVEICCRHDQENVHKESIVFGNVGKKSSHGITPDIKNIDGPDLETWLTKEFVWESKSVENQGEAPPEITKARPLQKVTNIFKALVDQAGTAGKENSAVLDSDLEKARSSAEEQPVANLASLGSASCETDSFDENPRFRTEIVGQGVIQPRNGPKEEVVAIAVQPKLEKRSDVTVNETLDEVIAPVPPKVSWRTVRKRHIVDEITFEHGSKPLSIGRGTRILLMDCYESRVGGPNINLPCSANEYKHLQEKMGFSNRELVVTLMYSSAQATRRTAKNLKGQDLNCFMFKIGIQTTGFYTVVVSYNLATSITHVFILAQTRKLGFSTINSWFEKSSSWKLEPFAIIRILLDGVLSLSHHSIETTDLRLSVLQSRMGQHTYRDKQRGDPLQMDFTWATRVLNHASTILAMNLMRVKGAQRILRKSRAFSELIQHNKINEKCTDDLLLDDSDGDILSNLLEALDDRCEHLSDQIEYELQRVQTQLAAVYTFMAAKDNIVNIGLAADSKQIATATKKDSSAMKTIAVLTMLFLPATFVAALFAMPVLDWEAKNGDSVFRPSFKYYWAITIPLTFTLILTWSLVLLLPWRRWLPWGDSKSETGSVASRNLGSVLDNDSSHSLVDD